MISARKSHLQQFSYSLECAPTCARVCVCGQASAEADSDQDDSTTSARRGALASLESTNQTAAAQEADRQRTAERTSRQLLLRYPFSPPPLCLRLNGDFPGEAGLAIVYWSKGWWRWWWQLDYWGCPTHTESFIIIIVTYHSLYLRFNGHFPGEPGLAGVYWSKGWWKWWWQLEL